MLSIRTNFRNIVFIEKDYIEIIEKTRLGEQVEFSYERKEKVKGMIISMLNVEKIGNYYLIDNLVMEEFI